jgi:hypothetical protein
LRHQWKRAIGDVASDLERTALSITILGAAKALAEAFRTALKNVLP